MYTCLTYGLSYINYFEKIKITTNYEKRFFWFLNWCTLTLERLLPPHIQVKLRTYLNFWIEKRFQNIFIINKDQQICFAIKKIWNGTIRILL